MSDADTEVLAPACLKCNKERADKELPDREAKISGERWFRWAIAKSNEGRLVWFLPGPRSPSPMMSITCDAACCIEHARSIGLRLWTGQCPSDMWRLSNWRIIGAEESYARRLIAAATVANLTGAEFMRVEPGLSGPKLWQRAFPGLEVDERTAEQLRSMVDLGVKFLRYAEDQMAELAKAGRNG
jgi:hypothetical protein